MRKIKTINFLKEDKRENKYFISFLLILVCILFLQGASGVNHIKLLEDDISQMKVSKTNIENKELKFKKSVVLENTKDVYGILGQTNIQSLKLNGNKVEIEGICEDLNDIDKLKNIDNIKNLSINSVEKKDDNYLFKVVYEIGGVN